MMKLSGSFNQIIVIDLVFTNDSTCKCEVLNKPNITDYHLVQITLNCNDKRNIRKCIVRKPLADPLVFFFD